MKLSLFYFQSLERICLDFCIELLNQRIGADKYKCILVCVFAVLDRSCTDWYTADFFSPILSKIIKLFRFFVLGQIFWLDFYTEQIVQYFRGERISTDFNLDSSLDNSEYQYLYKDKEYQSSLLPAILFFSNFFFSTPLLFSQYLHSRTDKIFQKWIQLIIKNFIIRNINSFFQWILDLYIYGIKISFSTIQPEYIGWVDPDRFLYKQLSFTTGKLRSWIYSLIYTIQNFLLSDLFLFSTTTDIFSVFWISLADNPSERKTGWSFLQNSCTK